MADANALFVEAKDDLLTGALNLDTADIRAVLVDLADWALVKAITGATNATPIVITSTSHGFANDDLVAIVGVLGNTAANGIFRVASQTANTFALTDPVTGANVAGNGAYTSGGSIIPLEGDLNLDDIDAAARVATSTTLQNTTVARGVFSADDITINSVSGDLSEVVVLYIHTGTASTSRLLHLIGTATSGLPFQPNSGNLTLDFSASGIFAI